MIRRGIVCALALPALVVLAPAAPAEPPPACHFISDPAGTPWPGELTGDDVQLAPDVDVVAVDVDSGAGTLTLSLGVVDLAEQPVDALEAWYEVNVDYLNRRLKMRAIRSLTG